MQHALETTAASGVLDVVGTLSECLPARRASETVHKRLTSSAKHMIATPPRNPSTADMNLCCCTARSRDPPKNAPASLSSSPSSLARREPPRRRVRESSLSVALRDHKSAEHTAAAFSRPQALHAPGGRRPSADQQLLPRSWTALHGCLASYLQQI
jgi:hypothetical protein